MFVANFRFPQIILTVQPTQNNAQTVKKIVTFLSARNNRDAATNGHFVRPSGHSRTSTKMRGQRRNSFTFESRKTILNKKSGLIHAWKNCQISSHDPNFHEFSEKLFHAELLKI